MANRLNKLAFASRTSAVPYRPYQPAYCVTQAYKVPAGYVVTGYNVITGVDSFGNRVTFYQPVGKWVPASTRYETVCYPAVPERPAVPSKTTYTAVTGWNAGASSVAALTADGYVEFTLPPKPFGVVVGFSAVDAGVSPNEQTHAFYVHGTSADILEGGRLVGSVGHFPGAVYRIARTGDTVRYLVAGLVVHTSANPSFGRVVLDASMYASGDYVDNPVVQRSMPVGAAAGALPPLVGISSDGAYSLAVGTLSALTGEGSEPPTPAVAVGALSALLGSAADRPYGFSASLLPPLTGAADGGFPRVSVVDALGTLPALSGYASGLTGTVGHVQGGLGALVGQGADRPYGAGVGSLAALNGEGGGGWTPYEASFSSPLVLVGAVASDSPTRASFSSPLELTSSALGQVRVHAEFTSTLMFVSTAVARYKLTAEFASALSFDFYARGAETLYGLDALLAVEAGQFSVNLDTGAVARYAGYAFDAYATVDDTVYGSRRSGVYRLRPGDDAGSPIDVRIDFGWSDFGTAAAKNLSYVYLGADTDATVTVRTTTNGVERSYRTHAYGTMLRAKLSGRPEARRWGISMDAVGATVFDLYSLEAVVATAARRVGS